MEHDPSTRNDLLARIPLPGDVIEAVAKRIGADRLVAWWESKTGRDCGCASRRDAMNRATETLMKWVRAGLK